MPYSGSLTDEEWEILKPLLPHILPVKKQTRLCDWTKRELLDGILYQLKNGCNWQDLPKDLPPYKGGLLAFLAVAHDRSIDALISLLTWTSASTSEKKPNKQRY